MIPQGLPKKSEMTFVKIFMGYFCFASDDDQFKKRVVPSDTVLQAQSEVGGQRLPSPTFQQKLTE